MLGQHEALHLQGISGLALLGNIVLVIGEAIGIVLNAHAQNGQLSHGELQSFRGVLALFGTQGDADVILTCQAVLQQIGQHLAVAHLHKDPGAVLISLLGAGAEQDGVQQLLFQQVRHILGVALAGGIGNDCAGGLVQLQTVQIGAEVDGGFLHVGAVERTGDLQAHRTDAHAGELLFQSGNALHAAGDHSLSSGVFVGNIDIFDALAGLGQRCFIGHAGHHGSVGIGLAHEAATLLGHGDQGFVIHHTVGPQSHQLTEAMTDEGVSLQTTLGHDIVKTCLHGSQNRLGVGGVVHGSLCGSKFLGHQSLGIEDLGDGVCASFQHHIVCLGNGSAQLGIVDGRFRQHIHSLSTLTGEQNGEFAFHSLAVVGDALLSEGSSVGLAQQLQRGGALVSHILLGLDHEGQTELTAAGIFIAIFFVAELFGSSSQRLKLFDQSSLAVGSQQNTGGSAAHTVSAFMLRLIFLQNHMEVGAAEAKGAGAGTTDRLRIVDDPGLGLFQNGQAAVHQRGVGSFHIDGVGQHLVVQSQRHLHAAGNTGSQTHMADLALDRADDGLALVALGEGSSGGTCFTGVAGSGAGAVGLQQTDGVHLHTGVCVGAAQRAHLTFLAGSVDALGSAIGGRTGAADHSVDLVAVTLRIGKTLQNHDAHTVTDDHAVCLGIKGSDLTGFGASGGLGEGKVSNGRIVQVGAAHQHHIHVVVLQLVNGKFHSAQRSAAGSVHRAGGAAQVKAVGDTACHHIGDVAGVIVLRPLVLGLQELGNDHIGGRLRYTVVHQDLTDLITLGADMQAEHMAGRTGRHDDTGVFSVEGTGILAVVTGIDQSLTSHDQTEQLIHSRVLHHLGGDAEFLGIKLHRTGLTAHFAVALIGYAGIGVIELLQLPEIGVHFLDAVLALNDILPILGKIQSTGENTSHADNCNFFLHC